MEQRKFETSLPGINFPAIYIKDKSLAIKAIEKLMAKDVLFGIDIETEALSRYLHLPKAALSPNLSKIRLIQVFDGSTSVVFDCKFIGDYRIFFKFLSTKRFIAHNAVFESMFFQKLGVKKMNIGCTLLIAKCIFHASRPNDGGLELSLEALMAGFLKIMIPKDAQVSDWSVSDLSFEQVEYAAIDAIAPVMLAETLVKGLKKYNLFNYYQLIKRVQAPIAHMQVSGLKLDTEGHRHLVHEWRKRTHSGLVEVEKLTGIDGLTDHKLSEWLQNNLDEYTLPIWPRTATGKLKTDYGTLTEFGDLPIVKPFSDYQKAKKLCTSFGNSLINLVNPETKRIHSSYKICGARTGRMSCTSPNLQQLPRDKAVRKNFIAEEGKVFFCADYSQIELRVAAELSQDINMLNAYRTGTDLHALTASMMAGKPIDQITKAERQFAKAVNFGYLFGLGPNTFKSYAKKSYGVEVNHDEALRSIETFRNTYPQYFEWQMNQAEEASVSLRVFTPIGKVRRLDPENTYGTAMNTPVQGGAAECIEGALAYIYEGIVNNNLSARLVNCVHDEVVVEGDPTQEQEIKDLIYRSMVKGFTDVFPNGITNNITEVGVGPNWADSKL